MSDTDYNISGNIAPGFEPVRDAFLANFQNGEEAGAGFYVQREGEVLVDLTGGTRDRNQEILWTPDTLVPVFSTTKAATALTIAWLVEQNRIEYDQTVASLWPDFAQHGKGEITIAQALSHQAGLAGFPEPMEAEDWYDWDGICAKLAAMEPLWEPGTTSGYHPQTYGFLAGEVARLADVKNRTLGTILREEICGPENIDFHIGTPESEHDRCVDFHKPRQLADFGELNPATRAAFLRKWSAPGGRRSAEWRQAEFAGSNGHGTAKAVARLMQLAVDGHIGETRYLSEHTLHEFSKERVSGPNLVLPFDLTYCAGIMINRPTSFYGPNESTLGQSGWGGSCTLADPSEGLTCAYVMNKQSHHLIGDPRTLRLINAVYDCLG